jgi:hypothetical protein
MSDLTHNQLEWKARYLRNLDAKNYLYAIHSDRTRRTMLAGKSQLKLVEETEDKMDD